MKLLFCPRCHDVRKLRTLERGAYTACECGKSWGAYTDNINAEYGGDAVMLGIANSSLRAAIHNDKNEPPTHPRIVYPGGLKMGYTFEAFVIPESAPTVKRSKS